MILEVDHHQICKFKTPFAPGYMNVVAQLKKIRAELLTHGAIDSNGRAAERNVHTQSTTTRSVENTYTDFNPFIGSKSRQGSLPS